MERQHQNLRLATDGQVEVDSTCSCQCSWPVVGLRQPVVKPVYGGLAEYEFNTALGRKIGLKDKDGKAFFSLGLGSGQPIDDLSKWFEEYISREVKRGSAGNSLAELNALPGAVWVDKKGTVYEKFAAPVSEAALKTAYFEGDPAAEGTLVYDKPQGPGAALWWAARR